MSRKRCGCSNSNVRQSTGRWSEQRGGVVGANDAHATPVVLSARNSPLRGLAGAIPCWLATRHVIARFMGDRGIVSAAACRRLLSYRDALEAVVPRHLAPSREIVLRSDGSVGSGQRGGENSPSIVSQPATWILSTATRACVHATEPIVAEGRALHSGFHILYRSPIKHIGFTNTKCFKQSQ